MDWGKAAAAAGAIGMVFAVVVVGGHLWRTIVDQRAGPIFNQDDKLLLVGFYSIVGVFLLFGLI